MTAYQTAPAAPAGDPTAVLGRRYAAAIIDIIVAVIFLIAMGQALDVKQETIPAQLTGTEACDIIREAANVSACLSIDDTVYYVEGSGAAALYFVPALAGFANHVVLQGLVGGSVGKLLVGIRVIKRGDGTNAGVIKNLVRWILNLIDWIPFCLPLVGIITSAASKGHRRVGDMAAGTLVVHKDAAGRPPVIPGLTVPTGYPTAPANGAPGYGAPGYGAPAPAPGSWGPPPAAPGAPSGWGPPPGAPPANGPWGAPPPPPALSSAAPPAPPAGLWPAPPSPPPAWDAPPPPRSPDPAEPTRWNAPEPAGWSAPADATVTMPAVDLNAPTGSTEAVASPEATPEPAVATEQAGSEQPAGVDAPMWDSERNAYIQWDPALAQWMQWDDAAQQWRPIS